MSFRLRAGWGLVVAGALVGALYAQKAFKAYPSVEGYESEPIPADYQRRGEWSFARLMYPSGPLDGYRPRFQGDWRLGLSLWTQDYPKADRMLASAVGRLTRVDARSVEQAVNLDDGDEIYNWPWLYAVQVGEWGLTEKQAAKLRDYLLRGGFFMADDFHGQEEQAYFERTMRMVFPERPIVDIPNADAIFHTVYDLDERFQIPGAEHLNTGYKKDGRVARWEGIYDDKGRIMVAISLNSDVGGLLGVGRYPGLSAEVFAVRAEVRRQLRHLRHDSLGHGHLSYGRPLMAEQESLLARMVRLFRVGS